MEIEQPKLISIETSETVKEEPTKKLITNFSNLLSNIKDREAFVKSVLKGPDKWSIRHRGPYYKAIFALQFKQVLDELMKDGKPRIYRYKDFPDLKSNTLYLKLNQSRLYLLDCLDTDGKYKEFWNRCLMGKKRGVGIIIHLRKDVMEDGTVVSFTPDYLSDDHADALKWKDDLEEYLVSEKKTPFEIHGLALTEEEQRDIELQLSQLPNVICRITEDKIIVIKE